ncbi:MAG: N-acetylneuraminate synthase [Candidatus Yanofskybacteria bacterium CG10_big_fil_rev_8_21_14_0_10_36_16]|uniref:N-acetylneuraminate synthase n=1 Tax=Candidatus Yanofskybacteria bacterium CG10_big_fil_rev_8_21_14_0_10_36_16 TaxID=1975096 RepID=A0A2J0Q7J5_9BACT|nr:MAG: N-acetylneuraminate synthase [Candidatus Yanofskybacteria bacterium CG10_big_fil_rev_8_21_14_0_10_36_16]
MEKFNKFIKIGNIKIGPGHKAFIIAEAGVNHNGNFKMAKKLISIASKSGADAIKFQTFNPETLIIKNAPKAKYQSKNIGKESHYQMLKKLMLPRSWHRKLKKYAEDKGLFFLSTPFSLDDAFFLKSIKVKAIKVGSSDANNIPYLSKMAEWQLPVILSTGMQDLNSVAESIEAIRKTGNNKLVVLQCTTSYPCPFDQANIRAMVTLGNKNDVLFGYSDHTLGIEAAVAAVSLGACVIEKHFTLDRNLPGPDHKASLEPDELKRLVEAIRNIEQALGSGEKTLTFNEKTIIKAAAKSVVATKDIKKGDLFSEKNIGVKRPGNGLPPKYFNLILGKKSTKYIKKDTLIKKAHYV